jgi:hypothetical protein
MARNTILAITRITFATGDLTAMYQAINGGGFSHPLVILRFVNASNNNIDISFDGITDHDIIPGLAQYTLNNQANSVPNSNVALFRKGTKVFVKSTTNAAGSLWLVGYYQPYS